MGKGPMEGPGRQVKIVQLITYLGTLYALTEQGQIYELRDLGMREDREWMKAAGMHEIREEDPGWRRNDG